MQAPRQASDSGADGTPQSRTDDTGTTASGGSAAAAASGPTLPQLAAALTQVLMPAMTRALDACAAQNGRSAAASGTSVSA